jgi:tRNA modification GTPase
MVAQSTARGVGAIAIVRISGTEAFAIAARLGCEQAKQTPYKLVRVPLRAPDGALLDDALVVWMPGPHSYTGEDLVELHVHGGEAVVAAVLEACLQLGARPAEPGEFTLRAFAHGRLDLAQAEAVGALIHAQTDAARQRALTALHGGLSGQIHKLLQRLEGIAAAWLSQLDFPDDTAEGTGATDEHRQACGQAQAALEALLGRMAAEDDAPPDVVLMGAVNTGKSTLLNALAGYERAIVDPEAGTTRDIIEVPLRFRGQRFQLWDTAGHRLEAQGVEARGIALGAERAQKAALVLWLCRGSAPLWPPSELTAPLLVLGAQADQANSAQRQALEQEAQARGLSLAGWISGRTGEGVDALLQTISARLAAGAPSEGPEAALEPMANLRHRQQLQAAIEALGAVEASMQQNMPLDLLLTDLQGAVRALGEIVGRDVDARVIDRIFSDFCIGK